MVGGTPAGSLGGGILLGAGDGTPTGSGPGVSVGRGGWLGAGLGFAGVGSGEGWLGSGMLGMGGLPGGPIEEESMQNRGGVIRLLLEAPGHRWRAGSPDSDGGR